MSFANMFWYDGRLIQKESLEVAITEPGLLYGATVFTTLRVYHQSLDSYLTHWREHCDRLRLTIETFMWQQPDWKRLRDGVEALLPHFPVIRITIFPDGREWVVGRFLPDDLLERQQSGVLAWLAEDHQFRRVAPEHKTGNYLSPWLALRRAQQLGAKEAILVDSSGNWLETSTGNLWGWWNGRWWTPPVEAGILPGVVRKQLLDGLKSHNKKVELEPWTTELVQELVAIAYSNSVVEVVPIHTILTSQGAVTCAPRHDSLEELRSLFSS